VAEVPDEGESEGLLLLVPALDVLHDFSLDGVEFILVHLAQHDVAGRLAADLLLQLRRQDELRHLVLAEVHLLPQDVDQQQLQRLLPAVLGRQRGVEKCFSYF